MIRNDHTAFTVSDLDAAIRFYTESLGLRLISRTTDPDHQEAFAFMELEGGNLELLQRLDIPHVRPPVQPPYCPHLALETKDMTRIVDMAKRKGIPVAAGPFEAPGAAKWIYLSDPDNNIIEYVERISK